MELRNRYKYEDCRTFPTCPTLCPIQINFIFIENIHLYVHSGNLTYQSNQKFINTVKSQ